MSQASSGTAASGEACAVCGATETQPWRTAGDNILGGPERFTAVRCVRCGTARLQPRPPAAEMGRYYAPTTYARAEGDESTRELGRRLDAFFGQQAARADAFAPVSPGGAPRRLLDVGCGDGRFLAAMAARGWKGEGIETSEVTANLARQRTGMTIHETPLEETDLAAEQFDMVSLLHVLEHVPDPRATLTAARRVLKPGGTLLLALPNAGSFEAVLFGENWYPLDLPRHYWGFTPRTLARLVEECGFSVRRRHFLPFFFALQSVRYMLRSRRRSRAGETTVEPASTAPRVESARQTGLFLALLRVSSALGRFLPGEVMELMAVKTDRVTAG